MRELQLHLKNLLKAIILCEKNGLNLPSLILTYSLIDILGSLIQKSHEKTEHSFKRWVDTYLLKATDLSCSAIDLYGARCAILHTLTPDSTLSRKGKAKRIGYTWGSAPIKILQNTYLGHTDREVALRFDDLFDGLLLGIDLFLRDVEANEELQKHVQLKAEKLFALIPYPLRSSKKQVKTRGACIPLSHVGKI